MNSRSSIRFHASCTALSACGKDTMHWFAPELTRSGGNFCPSCVWPFSRPRLRLSAPANRNTSQGKESSICETPMVCL